MITRTRAEPQSWIAAGATAAFGCGLVAALGGLAAGRPELMLVGGLLGGAALALLFAIGALDPASAVVLALPLPAVFASGEIRVAAVAPVTAAAVFAWFVAAGFSGRPLRLRRVPAGAVFAMVAAVLLATAFARDLGVAVRESFNLLLLLALLVALIDLVESEPGLRERLVHLLAATAAVCGLLAVLETVGVLPGRFPRWGTPFSRAALGFGQPNGLGLFLAASLPLAFHARNLSRTRVGRLATTAAVGLIVVGLFGTFSRGSWAALLLGALALPVGGEWRRAGRIWLGALAAAAALDLASGGMVRDTIARTFGDWVVEQRFALMRAGVIMFLDRPLTGVGPGGYGPALDRYGAGIPELWDLQPTPHNAYVQMAAEAGIPGLLAFCALLLAIFGAFLRGARAARRGPCSTEVERSLRQALLWSFATITAASLFVWPLAHGTGQVVMLVAAAGLARPPADPDPEGRS